eukprot:7877546-Ditylum_brightwellii.AAC.1
MVTCARIGVDYCPQKKDPNRVQITVGGNLINYPGDVATNTADLITTKLLWNSVLSTPGTSTLIPDNFLNKYNMHNKIHNSYVYVEIRKGMYSLPQAGKIANALLKNQLANHGYYEENTHQGYGNMTCGLSPSPCLLMILESNLWAMNTSIT